MYINKQQRDFLSVLSRITLRNSSLGILYKKTNKDTEVRINYIGKGIQEVFSNVDLFETIHDIFSDSMDFFECVSGDISINKIFSFSCCSKRLYIQSFGGVTTVFDGDEQEDIIWKGWV